MTPIDRDALERALVACRAESKARDRQLDAMLIDRPWERVARFAAFSVQIDSLGLMPWQKPPCRANLADLDQPPGDASGRRESAEILKKLVANNLSMYEPDPMRAIEQAERRQAAK